MRRCHSVDSILPCRLYRLVQVGREARPRWRWSRTVVSGIWSDAASNVSDHRLEQAMQHRSRRLVRIQFEHPYPNVST